MVRARKAHLSAVYPWSKYVITTGTGRKGTSQLAREEEEEEMVGDKEAW